MIGLAALTQRLAVYEQGLAAPDIRFFGYTVSELNSYYETLGEEGCQAYVKVADWDFFPYMFGYSILVGVFLLRASRQHAHPEAVALLSPMIYTCDLVETYVQKQGCLLFPIRLSEDVIQAGNYAVRTKWVLFIVAIVYVCSGGAKYLYSEYTKRQQQRNDKQE